VTAADEEGQGEHDVIEARKAPLSLQELESRLSAAANSLRGPVDPADFKSYVFPLLFFKWVSDTWDLDHAAAVDDFGDDLVPEVEADYHRFAVPDGCHWADLQKVSANVGVALQKILDRLAEANPDTLAGIFGDVAWGNKERLPEPALLNLIDSFDRLTLNRKVVPNDMLGAAYEYLLRQFADESGKKAGEFFTPRAVVRLLMRILDPQPGEAVYDPACGSGGMLVETINEVREAGGDSRTLRLYGQEVNLTTAAIARMNLFLHDLEDFRIVRGDTLRDPRFLERSGLRRFDVVVANPLLRGSIGGNSRPSVGATHGGLNETRHRPSWSSHAPWRPLPRWRREDHPTVPDRAGPLGGCDRAATQPLLLDLDPRLPAHLQG
jgi:type I restriction enzyme M protein